MQQSGKKRVLIFIVAYHAESTIVNVLARIPAGLRDSYDVDILIIDDSSKDQTFEKSYEVARQAGIPFDIQVLFNPVNQGYGGNQKLGYRYAIERGYDYVALLHGDGQYAPECLPALLGAFNEGDPAAVFGSRMLTKDGALRGGMPLYKFVGNKILTKTQNWLLRSRLSEFHSGYRLYSVDALRTVPFERNSNDFHFDTEIIIQLMFFAKREIRELPIPTYYGDEICRVNGIAYAANVVISTLKARLQELGIFYDRRYDCAREALEQYTPKFDYPSTHSMAMELVPENARVLDLGCAGGYMAAALREQKGCYAVGVDAWPVENVKLDEFYLRDLNEGLEGLPVAGQDIILMLDVIEHLASPERFLDQLHEALARNPGTPVVISTANIGFIIPRMMLMLGQFNYGKRGILDVTHTRLFTFSSFRRCLEQCGFNVVTMKAVPGPFPLALGNTWLSRFLVGVNQVLMGISRGMFGYQIFALIKPRPTVGSLLEAAHEASGRKARALESVS